jgi:ribosomal protein S18 acetylase RimI-like enzyme
MADGSNIAIRPARAAEAEAIQALVAAAYAVYLPRLGKPAGPVLDDYATIIAAGQAWVLEVEGQLAGALVLIDRPDHLLLDNVAVDPQRHGQGLGRRLIAFTEAEAKARGFTEIRLYTNEVMTENLGLYTRLGFLETHRVEEKGYKRIYMRKMLDG